MVEGHPARRADRGRRGRAARVARPSRGPDRAALRGARGGRLFPPAGPDFGNEEHDPHHPDQGRLVGARDPGDARNRPGTGRTAAGTACAPVTRLIADLASHSTWRHTISYLTN